MKATKSLTLSLVAASLLISYSAGSSIDGTIIPVTFSIKNDHSTVQTFLLSQATTIDDNMAEFQIPQDTNLEGIYGNWIGSIMFLPIKVHETFPNLAFYTTTMTSVKSIEKLNFENLNKLKMLNLLSNKIKDISSDAFDDLVELRDLNLRNNDIYVLSENLFKNLVNLEVLDLGHNNINSLGPSTFSTLAKLSDLFLNNNYLLELTSQQFMDNDLLEKVRFDNNLLFTLSGAIFTGKSELSFVNLRNNSCIDEVYGEIDNENWNKTGESAKNTLDIVSLVNNVNLNCQ